ncbi:zf-HC2 domain-containing protein [Carnobacterium divergens]|uniref:zf-HC2 domain-containing protein n=1 Tax=Carnobacterium divergens TaxID=2748 RepID=UPI00128BE3D5|nr:zf-HC2 domain-containing protein [Carnobacterium divergens]MPQ22135.1 zf-HC2 domain-containing protein [Carnobacterium divergens]
MDHNIFKDLVPNYIEHLTSKETNKQMEHHMEHCEECRLFFNNMKQELTIETRQEQKNEEQSIDAFKKVRIKNRKKIVTIILTLLAAFILIMISYYFLFIHMWLADSKDIQTTVTHQGNTVTMIFKTENKDHYLILPSSERPAKGYEDSLLVYEKRNDFSKVATVLQKGTSLTYTFINENTLLLPNGKEHKLTDSDIIQIKYKDKIQKIPLKELYQTEIEQK